MIPITFPNCRTVWLLGLLVVGPPLAAQDVQPLEYNSDELVE